MDRTEWARSVIRLGDGRGFVGRAEHDERFAATAAHCLPCLPPCMTFSFPLERTYEADPIRLTRLTVPA